MTALRRILGALAIAAAVRWAVLAWLQRSAGAPLPLAGYPNEWGVRVSPLAPGELVDALRAEREVFAAGASNGAGDRLGSAVLGLAGGPQPAGDPGAS